jgi:DNA replication protein DnaC
MRGGVFVGCVISHIHRPHGLFPLRLHVAEDTADGVALRPVDIREQLDRLVDLHGSEKTAESAEIAEKQARSIKYQLTIAKLPLAKDLDEFDFTGTPINEALVGDLASGRFIAEQRNAVLIGGTGTGKSHLAIAIARACIRGGARGRFYTVVDLVNRLESETRASRHSRLHDARVLRR